MGPPLRPAPPADGDTLATPPPAVTVEQEPPPVVAGRYELLSLLGSGGMGNVYCARDRVLDELVALKMLRSELGSEPRLIARFRREVKLARKVTHPNVARTFDVGEDQGQHYLTMELIEGTALSARLARDGPLPLAEVVTIAGAVCAGLSAAHAAGVIHRDLKPGNVILADDGRVVISDFGIARAGGTDAPPSLTLGSLVGTPAYMAPEQILAASEVDARADLYALGVMLYEMMTGQRPWGGDSAMAITTRRLTEPPPDPRAALPELPKEAAALVLRCMALRPADRYATAPEVARALAALPVSPASLVPSTPRSPHASEELRKTVAVLPFRNAGPAEDAYLADGMTDDLIDTLAMTAALRVRPRGMVAAIAGTPAGDPREVGAKLDVQVVVDGSVQRVGDHLHVRARVISVEDGFQLWARRFERPVGDFLAMGDEMARAVTGALTVEPEAPMRQAPADAEAIDLYLRARHELLKHWRDSTALAIDLYRQALARAPDNPTILAAYALALIRRFAADRVGEAAGKECKEVSLRALALAPHLAESHLAVATYRFHMGDLAGAAREIHETFRISPDEVEAHFLVGRMLAEAGDTEQGLLHLERTIAGEPRHIAAIVEVAIVKTLLGRYAEGRAMLRTAFDFSQSPYVWVMLGRFSLWQRDGDTARASLREIRAQPATAFPGVLRMLEVVAGESAPTRMRDEMEPLGSEPNLSSRMRTFLLKVRTEGFAYLGDANEALESLARAEAEGLYDVTWIDHCPTLEPLRTDARFAALRARVVARAASVREALTTVRR